MNHTNYARFTIGCVTFLASIAGLSGAWLLWKGFAGGGELVMTVNTAIAGLIGYLSANRNAPPQTGASGAITTEVVNPPESPLPVTETKATKTK